MDIMDSLYGFFGTSDVKIVAADILVAVVLAVSITYLVLEVLRIISEYTRKEELVEETIENAPVAESLPEKVEVISPPEKPVVSIRPVIEVLKGTLQESTKAIVDKYELESLTIASYDGLPITSTAGTPDEEAAIYTNKYNEIKKTQNSYFFIEEENIHLYEFESGSSKLVGVAKKKGKMSPEEIKGLKEDTKKIIDNFATVNKKSTI
ncbi:hypothetical protein CUJ83_14900 [Methanocella sp. CWC-04]|uniref:Uncharacterized protein n=1 Tax=Methanooceanicella nereidis TaxID=2052831 RepID=A0AAP2RF84_9EURY|nr:hypothetical protein [Methanocella sp. CWC-04]MCD1296289.1 hypothetical protein [Methanocella sp. CWC-04]